MPTSFKGLIMFAITATITVIVGLAIYNRVAPRIPGVARVVSGAKSA